jgi:hypothetical protein
MESDLHCDPSGITAELGDVLLNPSQGFTLWKKSQRRRNVKLLMLTIVQTGIGNTGILSFLARQKSEG